jgi:asparagine synthase (glutamine-hydrolysing)
MNVVDYRFAFRKQPIQGSDAAYVIHNGEVYNHQALRDGILKSTL